MSRGVSPWLQDTPAIVYRTLSVEELLQLWRGSRNSMTGLMAADEIMRRLDAKILTVEPYPEDQE
jgi:hypothetical protein